MKKGYREDDFAALGNIKNIGVLGYKKQTSQA